MLACQVECLRSNLNAAKIGNQPLPVLCCLHEECLEGKPAVCMLIQCRPRIGGMASVAPDMTLRLTTHKQIRV